MQSGSTDTRCDQPLHQALARLELINEIAAEVSADGDRRRLSAVLQRHAQLLLDVEDALLIVREPAGGYRLVIPETDREVSGSDVPATRLFVGGLVAECVRARTTRILRDTSTAWWVRLAPFERTLVGRGAAALAATPLIGRGVVHGALLFWSLDASAFHREARRTIAMVAPHVVNALMVAGLVEQVEARSPTDPLTGLPNRRALEQRLGEELDRAGRYRRPLCLALLDLDRVTLVNDWLGRAAGDAALRQLAALVRAERRSTDLVCRYDGEKLALILPETRPAEAVIVAERIRGRAEAGALGRHANSAPITLSVGVAGVGPYRDRAETLFAAANDALYRAKSAGRNRVRLASDPIVGVRGEGPGDHADAEIEPRVGISQGLI